MTRSQTIAAIVITAAVALLAALFFLSDGPDQVESLSQGDEAAEVEDGAEDADEAD